MSSIISIILILIFIGWLGDKSVDSWKKWVAGIAFFLFVPLWNEGYHELVIFACIGIVIIYIMILYDNYKYPNGYDKNGYDKNGRNRYGYNKEGYDKNGYDRGGYDSNGYNKDGYDRHGYDRQGYDISGYNSNGLDDNGYDRRGYKNGYNINGYDRNGYNQNGVDRSGFDKNGYNTNVFPFFQRNMTLLDTNILMADEKYDPLFAFFINYGVHITILASVFDELVNIKDSYRHSKDTKAAAYRGLNRISQLQDHNLLTLGDIQIQTVGKVYADPLIIEYLKTMENKSIALITNDLDVKIRANHFKGSVDTQAILGKDLIQQLYYR